MVLFSTNSLGLNFSVIMYGYKNSGKPDTTVS
jgi:hypothetical protein